MSHLTDSEELKIRLLADGIEIDPLARAYIAEANEGRAMTPADYATTSGLILELDGDVWVNAPFSEYNPNFVGNTPFALRLRDGHLAVEGDRLASEARMWIPPAYHGESNEAGEPYNSYAFTHSDRVRISPIEGCAMTCKFCDLPYEFRYRTKRIEGIIDAVRIARTDPIQPASHVLISGGTPREEDFDYVRDVYESVLTQVRDMPVDIMMVPLEGLLDIPRLHELGVNELSINIEIFNRDRARRLMRKKYDLGLDHYLDFIESAGNVIGRARVRSMLLVGIEPIEDTIAGVRAIAERGGVPVLSPFRPDPATPMRDERPPTADVLREVYIASKEICDEFDVPLGPSCIPCSHNTLTYARRGHGDAHRHYGPIRMI